MTNSYVNPIGMYPNLGYNDYQYLTAAMSTPNVNSPSFRGTSGAAQTTQVQPQVQYVQAEPQQKNNTGKVILGTLLVAGAALSIAAYRKGGDGAFFERIGKGFKMMFSKEGAAVTEKAAETAAEAATAGKRTIQEIGSKTVVTLPGEKNVITSKTAEEGVEKALDKVGLKADATEFAKRYETTTTVSGGTKHRFKDGNKMRSFWLDHALSPEEGKAERTYRIIGANVKGENVITIVDKTTGKKIGPGQGITVEKYRELMTKAEDIFAGKTDFATIDHMFLEHTNKSTGLISRFGVNKGKQTLKSAITDRFSIDNPKIGALIDKDEALKKAYKNLIEKHGEELTPVRGDVQLTGGPTITMNKDGEAIAVRFRKDGKDVVYDLYKDETLFRNYRTTHQADFEAAAKTPRKEWINRVFEF